MFLIRVDACHLRDKLHLIISAPCSSRQFLEGPDMHTRPRILENDEFTRDDGMARFFGVGEIVLFDYITVWL